MNSASTGVSQAQHLCVIEQLRITGTHARVRRLLHETQVLSRKGNEIAMPGDMREVLIGRQKWETVLATGCGYQKIDRPGIDTFRTASRTESRGRYIS